MASEYLREFERRGWVAGARWPILTEEGLRILREYAKGLGTALERARRVRVEGYAV